MNPSVTAGLKCPPVNCPPQAIAMNSDKEMKILEKTPLIMPATRVVFKQVSTP